MDRARQTSSSPSATRRTTCRARFTLSCICSTATPPTQARSTRPSTRWPAVRRPTTGGGSMRTSWRCPPLRGWATSRPTTPSTTRASPYRGAIRAGCGAQRTASTTAMSLTSTRRRPPARRSSRATPGRSARWRDRRLRADDPAHAVIDGLRARRRARASQGADGMWRASLLDPQNPPNAEATGTAGSPSASPTASTPDCSTRRPTGPSRRRRGAAGDARPRFRLPRPLPAGGRPPGRRGRAHLVVLRRPLPPRERGREARVTLEVSKILRSCVSAATARPVRRRPTAA